MTSYERFRRMYEHREADRVPMMDYPWGETVARWKKEGMPDVDYAEYFGLDKTADISVDNSPRFEARVIEENDEYRIFTTDWGATLREFKHRTATPEALDFKVNTSEAWNRIKNRFGSSDDRIPWKMLKNNYDRFRSEGRWITGSFWFGFDITHSHFVGTEALLIAMLEEPDWVTEMFDTELSADIKMMDRIWDAGYRFDEVSWPDDMGYKNSQFFSMKLYRELVKPFHQRAIDWAHNHGIPARLHSCGDVNPFVPELVEMGLDAINPLEVKAGMNPVEIKMKYGDRLVLHGGINAVDWADTEKMIAGIESVVPVLKENGGYIFASDHSIPPSVSFDDFGKIMEVYKKCASY